MPSACEPGCGYSFWFSRVSGTRTVVPSAIGTRRPFHRHKVWVEAPDQNLWEISIVKEDLAHGSAFGSCVGSFDGLEDDGAHRLVIYKGPFRELVAGDGRRFPRGQDVLVPARAWERLRQGPAAQFVFSVPAAKKATGSCSSSCS